jgi:hypothetical protein
MQHTALQIEAAEAAIAAAAAAGRSLPAPYYRQQPSPLLKLTISLLQFMQALMVCWPSAPIASPQVSQIMLPATQLVLTAFRLALQLLGAGNRALFDKLYTPCSVFSLALAQAHKGDEQLSVAAAAANDMLLRTALLPQLQLLLLNAALKIHYHRDTPASSSSSSSGGSRQQHPSLHASQHRYLLAMLSEYGLSGEPAAAAAPLLSGTPSGPTVQRSGGSSSKLRVSGLLNCFCYSGKRTLMYFNKEASAASDQQQQQQQPVQAQQESAGTDAQQLKQLSQLCQPATLMLLEAAYNLFLSDAGLAATATSAAALCTNLAAVAQTLDSSDEDTAAAAAAAAAGAAADDITALNQPTAGRIQEVHSVGSSSAAVRPLQQQQQQRRERQSLFVARLLRQVRCIQQQTLAPAFGVGIVREPRA